MNRPALLTLTLACTLAACDRNSPPDRDTAPDAPTTPAAGQGNGQTSPAQPSETPLLPVQTGDFWRYDVQLEVHVPPPPGDKSPPTMETRWFKTTRTYLGKLAPFPDKPEVKVDVFEVVTPGSGTERELVEIDDDQIRLRGSIPFEDGVAGHPVWFEPPVPFVAANIRAGAPLPSLSVADGEGTRDIQVVGREEVTVPAGTFRAIKLLMSGMDSKAAGIEMRRTIWFAPGVGIVKDVTSRYSPDAKLFTRSQELTATSVKLP